MNKIGAIQAIKKRKKEIGQKIKKFADSFLGGLISIIFFEQKSDLDFVQFHDLLSGARQP